MKITFFIYLFLTISNAISADSYSYSHVNNIPTELQLVLSTKFDSNNREPIISETIGLIDMAIDSISPEEVSLLIKIEILRSMLTYFNSETSIINDIWNINPDIILQKANTFNAGTLEKWVILSLAKDFSEIIKNPGLKGLLFARKKNEKDIPGNLLKLEKKALLILPWIQRIQGLPNEDLSTLFAELNVFLLKKINHKLKFYMIKKNGNILNINTKTWKHFKEIPYLGSPIKKNVEEIIGSIESIKPIEEKAKPKEKSIISEWKPETTPEEMKLPENWPKATTKYRVPKELPLPVNDWIMDL